jgi:hypothetical protein
MRGTTAVAALALAVVLLLFGGAPALAGPALHDHPAPTPTAPADPHAGHSGHGRAAVVPVAGDGGTSDTRLAVLGGFALVNAAVVVTALVLRRTGHGRRTAVVR